MGVMKNEAEKEAGVYHDRIGLLRTRWGSGWAAGRADAALQRESVSGL